MYIYQGGRSKQTELAYFESDPPGSFFKWWDSLLARKVLRGLTGESLRMNLSSQAIMCRCHHESHTVLFRHECILLIQHPHPFTEYLLKV